MTWRKWLARSSDERRDRNDLGRWPIGQKVLWALRMVGPRSQPNTLGGASLPIIVMSGRQLFIVRAKDIA
jgi:hypothetical protein